MHIWGNCNFCRRLENGCFKSQMSHESWVMSQWVRSEKIKASVETIKLSIAFTHMIILSTCFIAAYCCEVFWRLFWVYFVFVLDDSLVTRVLLWSLYRSRLIRICVDRFSNSTTFWSSFWTWMSFIRFECQSLKWARFGTVADLDCYLHQSSCFGLK